METNTSTARIVLFFSPFSAFKIYSGFLKSIHTCIPLRGNRQDCFSYTYKITSAYKFLAIVVTRFFLLPLPKSLKKTVYNNLHLKYFKVLDSDFPRIIFTSGLYTYVQVLQAVAGIWLSMESALNLVSDVTDKPKGY